MSDATQHRKTDRTGSRLLRALAGRLERYMARAGLMAFAVDGGDAPAGGTHLGGDAPAAGAAGQPAGDKPAGDAPAGDKPAGDQPANGDKPAGDAKPEGDKPAADAKPGDKKPDDGKPAGAPEKYEDFKLPEGIKMDDAVLGEFQQLAKDLNLPQEAAQKLVDLGAKMQTGNAEQIKTVLENQGKAWGEQALLDKEFGGEKFQENLAVAKKGLDQFATPELKTLLVQSKLGNHPEVLRTFFRIGQAISEDGFVPGRVGSARKSNAEVLYGNTTH